MLSDILQDRFKQEWTALDQNARAVILQDFSALLHEEYDTPDVTMSDDIAYDNAYVAALEYHRRIGSGNLASYATVLLSTKRTNDNL